MQISSSLLNSYVLNTPSLHPLFLTKRGTISIAVVAPRGEGAGTGGGESIKKL